VVGPALAVLLPGQPVARRAENFRAWGAKKLLWLLGAALLPGPAHAQAPAIADVPPLAYGAMFQQHPQARQVT